MNRNDIYDLNMTRAPTLNKNEPFYHVHLRDGAFLHVSADAGIQKLNLPTKITFGNHRRAFIENKPNKVVE